MTLSVTTAAEYLARYVTEYRREYTRLTTVPPQGGGYPSLVVSPYLYSEELLCLLSPDGATIVDQSREPEYQWWIAGGPALMVDFPETTLIVYAALPHGIAIWLPSDKGAVVKRVKRPEAHTSVKAGTLNDVAQPEYLAGRPEGGEYS